MDPFLENRGWDGQDRAKGRGSPTKMGLDDAFAELGWGEDAWYENAAASR
jgi:hypothetical protein